MFTSLCLHTNPIQPLLPPQEDECVALSHVQENSQISNSSTYVWLRIIIQSGQFHILFNMFVCTYFYTRRLLRIPSRRQIEVITFMHAFISFRVMRTHSCQHKSWHNRCQVVLTKCHATPLFDFIPLRVFKNLSSSEKYTYLSGMHTYQGKDWVCIVSCHTKFTSTGQQVRMYVLYNSYRWCNVILGGFHGPTPPFKPYTHVTNYDEKCRRNEKSEIQFKSCMHNNTYATREINPRRDW